MLQEIKTLLSKLRGKDLLSIEELENLLINTYRLLDSEDENDYNLSLSVICHVADSKPQDKLILQLLHDCIIKSRIFLYDNLLETYLENYIPQISAQDSLARSFYTSKTTDTILTKPQKVIFDLFQKHRRLMVSAPTSFGKTRIIREIIKHNQYKNIALIMPTVSLLSEQYQELKENIKEYIISKSSKVKIDDSKKYILILTPERMNVFLEENPNFQVDFFVMDEIYKVDYKLEDDRFQVFSDILYQLAKTQADFYLIGPYITSFSEKFCEKFNVTKKIFNIEIVQKDYYCLDNISEKGTHNIERKKIKIISDKFDNLKRLLAEESIHGKFLIYRYRKDLVEERAEALTKEWPIRPYNEELIEYLKENVSNGWSLLDCIKRGIAFHHGAMPRHIQDLIVDEFNNPVETGIRFLFCTTSLTEGVNTSAKNVILYDSKIGKGDILKSLDRKNIEGRAGRFMKHFVGRVFYLDKIAENEAETNVEIEVLDNENPSVETIIQTNDEDLLGSNKQKKESLINQLSKQAIPFELIKKNKFVNIEGQVKLIQKLRNENLSIYFFSNNLPELETNRNILSLIYDYLFTDSNKGGHFNNDVGKSILIRLTNFYLYHKPSFKDLLESDTVKQYSNNENTKIRYVFDLISKYFEFIWPRYIKAFESLYNLVAKEKDEKEINLDMVIATLEYGTTETHEILLKDAGVPNEIIRKISSDFRVCENFESIQEIYNQKKLIITEKIHPIEMKILKKYI